VQNKRIDILRLLTVGAQLPALRYAVECPGLLLYGEDVYGEDVIFEEFDSSM